MADWSAWTNPQGGGLLGTNPWEYIGNLGAGILANSGPSLQPTGGFGGAVGRGLLYANEAQSQSILNDQRRMEMTMAAQELEGMKQLQAWMAANQGATQQEMFQAAMTFLPQTAMKGWISNLSHPLVGLQALQAQQAIKAGETEQEAKTAALQETKQAQRQAYRQLATADAAFARLAEIPGADALLNNPQISTWVRSGLSGTALTKKVTEALGKGVIDIDPKDLPDALSAVELIRKARTNIAGMTQNAVASQKYAMEGLGEGVGMDEQAFVFREQLAELKNSFAENKWDLPETGNYPFMRNKKQETAAATPAAPATTGYMPPGFAAAQPTYGVQNGGLVQQPPTVTNSPPAFAASAPTPAPAPSGGGPRKVGTLRMNAQGVPTFRGWSELQRAEGNGQLQGITSVEVGGKIYDWVP